MRGREERYSPKTRGCVTQWARERKRENEANWTKRAKSVRRSFCVQFVYICVYFSFVSLSRTFYFLFLSVHGPECRHVFAFSLVSRKKERRGKVELFKRTLCVCVDESNSHFVNLSWFHFLLFFHYSFIRLEFDFKRIMHIHKHINYQIRIIFERRENENYHRIEINKKWWQLAFFSLFQAFLSSSLSPSIFLHNMKLPFLVHTNTH